jgi:carbonic anhydrase/acetyltransferase-like protein (isoleucine patch superfamily)
MTIIAVIFLLVVIGGMGVAVSRLVSNPASVVATNIKVQDSLFSAQSGIEWAFQYAVDNSLITPAQVAADAVLSGTHTLPNGETFVTAYTQATDTLSSISTVSGAERKVIYSGFAAAVSAATGGGVPGGGCTFLPAPPGGYVNLKIKNNQSQSLGPGDFYINKLDIKDNATLTITGPATIYVQDKMQLKKSASLIINGNVRFVVKKDVIFKDNASVTLNPGANLYINAKKNIQVEDDATINSGGNSANVLLTANKDIKITDNSVVSAGAYADKKFKLDKNAVMTGAVGAGKSVKQKGSSTFIHDPAAGTSVINSGVAVCSTMANGLGPI